MIALSLRKRIALIVVALAVACGALYLLQRSNDGARTRVIYTLGEVQTVHAQLRVGAREVRGVARFAIGDVIATGEDGRGRIHLDDGTSIVMDRDTRLQVGPSGLELEAGRIFVQGGAHARTALSFGAASTLVSASAVGVERGPQQSSLYCANGEVVVRADGKQARVRSGETVSITAGTLEVVPEQAWNDWTGGMATPWSATGRPRAAIGELWSRQSGQLEAGAALAIRAHEVTASFDGEVARTRVETSYFNAGSAAVSGDFRMAIPNAALVSRFALRSDDGYQEGTVYASKLGDPNGVARLEWAGEGWLRGFAPAVRPGATLTVLVEYVEWLSAVGGRVTYRYPMLGDQAAPLIGELHVQLDTSGAHPRSVAVSGTAALRGNVVELRGADVRPAADFVVQLEVPAPSAQRARAYVAHGGTRDPNGDDYMLLRAPLPAATGGAGVALALVLDTSWSIAPGSLDAGRALIEAILEGLGAHDRVSVLAADQATRAIGPVGCLPVDAARRAAVRAGLIGLRPAGASDLGAALEQAADTLPKDASGAMVVYIGDGWPTVGDTTVTALRARLSRRSGGVPRIAAVTLGPLTNRFGLRALVRDSGPVLQVSDRAEAAQAAVSLLAGALEPSVDGVEFDLGPSVDRVYPRAAQTVSADGMASVVGRLRGKLPSSIVVRFRRAGELVEETRPLDRIDVAQGGDIRRRWTAGRVEDIALRGEPMDASAELAARARLLTPYTGFYISESANAAVSAALPERLLELSESRAAVGGKGSLLTSGTLFEPELSDVPDSGEDFRSLIAASARRTLDAALPAIRRCRDARSALHPELPSTLHIQLNIDGRGHASQVRVTQASDDDRALDLCVAMLVGALPFFDSGTTSAVPIDHEIELPALGEARARVCSPTAKLPLPLRRGIWAERVRTAQYAPSDLQQRARRACELPSWTDQRVLLELILDSMADGETRIAFAKELARLGEVDAADYVRRVAIARCVNPEQLAGVRLALLGVEPKPGAEFARQYRAADADDKRLLVVQRFLRLSPHDATLRRALLSLLEKLQQTPRLLQAINELRSDPFVDAGVLADGAAALHRLGRRQDAQRAFGELIERAPNDPYARAYAGDRMRDVGLFDDASAAYESLDALLSSDPAAALRLALAHAGAGRLDVATRVLERVAQTGGRTGDNEVGELASIINAVLIAEARAHAQGDELARLERRALEVPLPDLAGLVLVRTPRLDQAVAPRLARTGSDRGEQAPDLSAPSIGLFVMRLERGDRDVRILLRRPDAIASANSAAVRVDVLSLDDNRAIDKLVHRELVLAADGKPQEVHWQAGALL